MTRILAFAGSARRDSFNKKLCRLVAERARSAGAEVELIDLAELRMPLYDGDGEAESGLPADAIALQEKMKANDGLLIACPEYNSSITPLLKNSLDWASRPQPGDPPLAAFQGKVAGLVAASPGALGGLRGLVHVRSILGNVGVHVIPTQVAVPKAHELFGGDDPVTDGSLLKRLDGLCAELVRTTTRLCAGDGGAD